jgi:hypothetical protein
VLVGEITSNDLVVVHDFVLGLGESLGLSDGGRPFRVSRLVLGFNLDAEHGHRRRRTPASSSFDADLERGTRS